jgi:hypothetical protein
MTNKEASFLLGACRPNGADENDPEFSEALVQAERDPALKAWFDDQRRTDTAIAAGLKSVPAPADLRSRILTGGRLSQPNRPRPWFSTRQFWAIAAAVALMAGMASWYTGTHHDSNLSGQVATAARPASEWQDVAMATLSQLVAGKATFDEQSPKIADLQQWLHANGSPVASTLPGSVQQMHSLGCKTISWNGHPASLICFHGPNGELVHLAMVASAAIANPPPEGHPLYAERNGWRIACWSQDGMAMMLLTKAPESQLRTLLAFAIVP